MTLADAQNLIASDSTTNSEITNGVADLIGATSVGLPIDMSLTTATSTIEYSNCGFPLGGWSYTFSTTQLTLFGTDTWTSGCGLGAEHEIVLTMSNTHY